MEQRPAPSSNFYRGLTIAMIMVTPFWVGLLSLIFVPARVALGFALIVTGLALCGLYLMLKYTRRT